MGRDDIEGDVGGGVTKIISLCNCYLLIITQSMDHLTISANVFYNSFFLTGIFRGSREP